MLAHATLRARGVSPGKGFANMGWGLGGSEEIYAARFQNVLIPNGAVINSSLIHWKPITSVGVTPINNEGSMELDANPGDFASPCDIKGRAQTVARQLESWFDGTGVWTPPDEFVNLNPAAVQEVIDLPAWISGNPMVMFHRGDPAQDPGTDSQIIANGYANDPAKTVELTIDFTLPFRAWVQDGDISIKENDDATVSIEEVST